MYLHGCCVGYGLWLWLRNWVLCGFRVSVCMYCPRGSCCEVREVSWVGLGRGIGCGSFAGEDGGDDWVLV